MAALAAGGLLAMLTNSLIPFAFERGGQLAGIATAIGFCALDPRVLTLRRAVMRRDPRDRRGADREGTSAVGARRCGANRGDRWRALDPCTTPCRSTDTSTLRWSLASSSGLLSSPRSSPGRFARSPARRIRASCVVEALAVHAPRLSASLFATTYVVMAHTNAVQLLGAVVPHGCPVLLDDDARHGRIRRHRRQDRGCPSGRDGADAARPAARGHRAPLVPGGGPARPSPSGSTASRQLNADAIRHHAQRVQQRLEPALILEPAPSALVSNRPA